MNINLFNRFQKKHFEIMEQNNLKPGSKILFVSDSADEDWCANNTDKPLVNGVKRFSETMVSLLKENGYQVDFLHPYILDEKEKRRIKTTPIPFYPDVEFAFNFWQLFPVIRKAIIENEPDAIFIATVEGPLGFFTSRLAKMLHIPYSLVFTTNLHEYIGKYINNFTKGHIDLPSDLTIYKKAYHLLYKNAKTIFVPTPLIKTYVQSFGINPEKIIVWPHGIDTEVFHPPETNELNPYQTLDWYQSNPLPILIYFGRISIDKRVDDFLNLDQNELEKALGTKCHKVIIGTGLNDPIYRKKYADSYTHFLGGMKQIELASYLRWADLFIFPSVTDTFGIVLLESAASGVPIVGRIGEEIASTDVLTSVGGIGIEIDSVLLEKLKKTAEPIENYPALYAEDQQKWIKGIQKAFQINMEEIIKKTTQQYSWENAMHLLLENI